MSDFFEKVKANAFKTKDEAVKIGKQVMDKAGNVVSQTKLNFAVNDAENKIKDIYAEIGKMVYSSYKADNMCCEAAKENCEKIDKLFEEVEALKEQIAELKDSVKCPNCGSLNKQGSAFCSKCGAPVEGSSDSTAEEDNDAENVYDEEESAPETVKKVITIKAKKPENADND